MKELHRQLAVALAITTSINAFAVDNEREIPPAFGPHVNLTAKDFAGSKSFTAKDRIVGTYYFYWYDISTKSHITNPENGSDGLTTHPPTLEDFSYKSVRWHKKQLSDMEAAGIDVALMVFWGSPAEHATNTALHWSFAGLPPLVQAREELLREGKHPPRIGLFYDTSTLQNNHWNYHADLTTDYGKKFFYGTVRDFFSCLPPKHWAMMDGKPIVLMYAAAFAKKWDQGFIDYTKAEFPKEFGGRVPWIAPQRSWNVKGDATCDWGGALAFRNPGIGEIGPGYNDSHVFGRTPLIREREGGKFYEESWLKFLRRPTNFVMIETWSEFHEGTDIAESKEYGRQYIELTRKYSRLFKRGWKPASPKDEFTGAKSATATPATPKEKSALALVPWGDGPVKTETVAGRGAWAAKSANGHSCYVYFRLRDSFKPAGKMNAAIEVEYFDTAPGQLSIEFDGSDPNAPFGGAYTRSEKIALTGDKQWKTASFKLNEARFLNSQNGSADFRVVAETAEFAIARVTLTRR
ncbi:MAG: hypothetical protein EXS35_08665 [Pedosphaera sp.]|nr:hypothetical protein [Pedosphaera sp.]